MIRHTCNEVQDLTASLLTEVSHNVATEPSLQPLTSETFLLHLPTPLMMLVWILRPEASGVGARMHNYFDVRVFYPSASSDHSINLPSAYKHHEDAKKQEYGL